MLRTEYHGFVTNSFKKKTMDLIKVNKTALAGFNQIINLSNELQQEHKKNAAWFDTPEKRMQWWIELEEQWRRAFREAVFFKQISSKEMPADDMLQHIFELTSLQVCGNMKEVAHRNNNPDIDFQLTNLSGVKHLTNLTRIECDYNGLISSLEPLQNLHQLEVFWCDNNSITDLSPIVALPSLKDICCWNNQITDISIFSVMPQLRHITLALYGIGNPIESYASLQSLPNLQYAYVPRTPETLALKKTMKETNIFISTARHW